MSGKLVFAQLMAHPSCASRIPAVGGWWLGVGGCVDPLDPEMVNLQRQAKPADAGCRQDCLPHKTPCAKRPACAMLYR